MEQNPNANSHKTGEMKNGELIANYTGRDEVFISYSSRDREKVFSFVRELRNTGVSVWLDRGGIDGALLWGQEIVEAIDNCKVLILMVSPSSVDSHNVVREVALASEGKKHILPLHLEPTKIPATMRYQLAGIQHIELFRGEKEEVFNAIVKSLARLGVKISAPGKMVDKQPQNTREKKMETPFITSAPVEPADVRQSFPETKREMQFKKVITCENLNTPSLIKLDSEGNLYVTDSGNDRIIKFSPEGEILTSWGSHGKEKGQFNRPMGIAVDNNGNILVTDNQQARVQKFSPSGEFIDMWGKHISIGGNLHVPRGIAVDSERNIYITDGYPDHPRAPSRVQKFTPGGDLLLSWGYEGSEENRLKYPYGITVDSSGKVYVADTHNHCIQVYDSGGEHLMRIEVGIRQIFGSALSSPVGIDIDREDNIYLTNSSGLEICKFTPDGEMITRWGGRGIEDGKFLGMSGIAVDSSGCVFVADDKKNCIQVFCFTSIL